jgi:hypothetical protein
MGHPPVDWVVSTSEEGLAFRWGYAGDDLVAEWEGIVAIRATRSGELKALDASPRASKEVVEKTRRGAVTAFLRAQRKQHSLHASAVVLRGAGLACIGASGAGKSTLADYLCREHDAALLADDIAAIDLVAGRGVAILPTERAVWLAPDAASEVKAPVQAHRRASAAAPLRWIAALAFDESASSPSARELHGGDAVSAMLPTLIRFEKTPELWARELDFLATIASQCRIVELTRSRRVAVGAAARALCDAVGEGAR